MRCAYRLGWLLPLLLILLSACRKEAPPTDYVARVGDRVLTRQELAEALATLPVLADSAEASRQIIERWIDNALLYREAQRRRLHEDPDVRRLLEDNERSVLISAYLNKLYEEEQPEPSPASIQAYFEQHREQLRLREPYVRIRYLATPYEDSARAAHDALRQALNGPNPDSAWTVIARRWAEDPEASLALARSYLPETHVFAADPALRETLKGLRPGALAPLVPSGGQFHILHLVERIPAGTLPELPWVEEEIKERLRIETRKQMYARQVQRLRNEALAREELDIR